MWIRAHAEIIRGIVLGPYHEDIPAPGPADPPEEARLSPRPDNRNSVYFLVVRHDALGLPNVLSSPVPPLGWRPVHAIVMHFDLPSSAAISGPP